MREFTACRHCNRYISPDFRFCPYCGTERVHDYQFKNLLDEPFDEMEREVKEYSVKMLQRLEDRLTGIEGDLEAMLDQRGRPEVAQGDLAKSG